MFHILDYLINMKTVQRYLQVANRYQMSKYTMNDKKKVMHSLANMYNIIKIMNFWQWRERKKLLKFSTCTFASVDRFQQSIHIFFFCYFDILCLFFIFVRINFILSLTTVPIDRAYQFFPIFSTFKSAHFIFIFFSSVRFSFNILFAAIDHRRLWQFAQFYVLSINRIRIRNYCIQAGS